jgi:hypothetical protein
MRIKTQKFIWLLGLMVKLKYKLRMHIQIFDKLCLEQLHECSVCPPTKENWIKKTQNIMRVSLLPK